MVRDDQPVGETKEALHPPSETTAPIGRPARSAKTAGRRRNQGPKPVAQRRDASWHPHALLGGGGERDDGYAASKSGNDDSRHQYGTPRSRRRSGTERRPMSRISPIAADVASSQASRLDQPPLELLGSSAATIFARRAVDPRPRAVKTARIARPTLPRLSPGSDRPRDLGRELHRLRRSPVAAATILYQLVAPRVGHLAGLVLLFPSRYL